MLDISISLCPVALDVESVGAEVAGGALEAGDDAHVAGGHLRHHVREDHRVVRGVAPRHEADVVPAHILPRSKCFIIIVVYISDVC